MEDFKGTRGKWEVDPYDKSLVRSTNTDNGQIAECHSPDDFCQDIINLSNKFAVEPEVMTMRLMELDIIG